MKKLLFFSVYVLALSACSPVYYAPSSQHVPLLTEEEEFTVAGNYVGANSVDGASLRAAYALNSNWGLIGGGSLFFNEGSEDNSSNGSGGHFEAGGGYFTEVSNKFVFETYGLLGYGNMVNRFPQSIQDYPGTDGEIKANILSLALQPAFGFKSKYFEAAISLRTGMINYSGIRGDLMTQNDDQDAVGNQQEYLKDNRSNLLFEPALTIRGGLEFLKIEAQTGGSLNLTNKNFPQETSWLSIGLIYRFED